jgi:hypothetical protein
MIKKIALALLFAITLCPAASFAQVSIRIGPPVREHENRGRPPERGYVWIGGYQRYEGDRYVWTPGRWERPPQPNQRWVDHKWKRHHGEWQMQEGHWR